jgi:hypothetical protein
MKKIFSKSGQITEENAYTTTNALQCENFVIFPVHFERLSD